MKKLILLLAACVSACAQTTIINAGSLSVQSLAVSPATANVTAGATLAFNCIPTLVDGQGNTSTGTPINSQASWSSSSPAVATITSGVGQGSGIASGVAAGTTTITCSENGVPTTGATLTVLTAPNWSTVSMPNGSNGIAYNFSFAPFVSGGVLPYTFTCPAACALPGWATLALNGSLTGTAATGVSTFAVKVCDAVSSCATTSVTLTVITTGFGPPNYTGSTTLQLAQNKVAGCNSNVTTGFCGSPSTSLSLTANVLTINVPNSFVNGSIIGISGCTLQTYLNGLILTANSSTTSSAIVGTLANVQGTAFTHADVASTAEANCYLQGQGWQPFYLAPFPAPGSASCPNGNGSVGCAVGSMINTWALDWAMPSGALNSAPNNVMVAMSDKNFNATREYDPGFSGETNDQGISLDDTAGGYFFTMVYGGANNVAHGHFGTCGGKSCFLQDVTTSSGLWTVTGTNYGGFTRLTRPGVNQAKWYTVDFTNQYAPVLKSYILTYAAGAVTASAPTTLYNVNTCPGWKYTTVAQFGQGEISTIQFKVDNFDNHVIFGFGSGPQNKLGRHMEFDVSLANNTCETLDSAGMSGSALYAVNYHSGGQGTGYAVNDTVQEQETGGVCVNTLKITSVNPGGIPTGIVNTTNGTGCFLAQSVTTTTVTGTGSGLVLDVSGIGTPGIFINVYTPNNPVPVTTAIVVFGQHSGNMDQSGTYGYISGWGDTAQAPCSSCGYIYWTLGTSTLTTQTNPLAGGHPGIGYGWVAHANTPYYYKVKYPDGSCTILADCPLMFTLPPTYTTGMQPHFSWPSPLNDQSYPMMITSSVNVSGSVRTDPPGWTCPFGQSAWAIAQDGTTRWFAHHYQNSANTLEPFQPVDTIWTMSPDGKFALISLDMMAGFSGNTGAGTSSISQLYAAMFSLTFN